MDRTNHLSRHFLGTQPDILRSIPFAPPGPPYEDGAALKHRLLALADWNEDSQVYILDGCKYDIHSLLRQHCRTPSSPVVVTYSPCVSAAKQALHRRSTSSGQWGKHKWSYNTGARFMGH